MPALSQTLARKPVVVGLILCLMLLALGGATLLAWRQEGSRIVAAAPRAQKLPATPDAAGLQRLPARPGDIAAHRLEPLGTEAARKLNAATPFAELKPTAARAFRFTGSAVDRARSIDCLALAAMAEAGGGDDGQRSVIQVILNRVRHPAFAKTICGVVFQGAERTTGCQFTFTCDGSLARRYSDTAWSAARRRAGEALDGKTYARVGAATHYHTDWVHPVWSKQLDKIAQVDTHLFFRWPGYWGSRDAGRVAYRGGEPAIAEMSWRPAHATGGGLTDARTTEARSSSGGLLQVRKAGERVGIGVIAVSHPEGGAYLTHLDGSPTTAAALSLGRRICGGRGYCRVWGWTNPRDVPKAFPVSPAARGKLSFSYVLDASNAEYLYYDCGIFQNVPRDHCLPPARE